MGMSEHDRVMNAFRNCITEPKCKDCPWDECEALGNRKVEIPLDLVLAVMRELAAQEPRVMKVDEVRTWVSTPRIDREPIWVEIENGVSAWIVSDEYWDMPIDANLSSDLYGKTWRCWTSRPTEAQREETPWESDIARSAEES